MGGGTLDSVSSQPEMPPGPLQSPPLSRAGGSRKLRHLVLANKRRPPPGVPRAGAQVTAGYQRQRQDLVAPRASRLSWQGPPPQLLPARLTLWEVSGVAASSRASAPKHLVDKGGGKPLPQWLALGPPSPGSGPKQAPDADD